METRRAGCALAVIVAAAFANGCSCASERTSEPATGATGRWPKAYVTVKYRPSYHKNGHHVAPSVLHALTIETAAPSQAYVILLDEDEDSISGSLFSKLRNMTYQVRISPDDSTLAASTDGGKAWTLFALQSLPDSTREPFYCRHVSFPSIEPWPSMRSLAIEILGTVDPGSPRAAAHRSEDAIVWPEDVRAGKSAYRWKDEVIGATRYACARKEDAELVAAFVSAYFGKDYPWVSSEMGECLEEIAKKDLSVRARLDAKKSTRH